MSSTLSEILGFLAPIGEVFKKTFGRDLPLGEFVGCNDIEAVKLKVIDLLIRDSEKMHRELEELKTQLAQATEKEASPPPPATVPSLVETPKNAEASPPPAAPPVVIPEAPVAKVNTKSSKKTSYADLAVVPPSEEVIAMRDAEERRRQDEIDRRTREALSKEATRAIQREESRISTNKTVKRTFKTQTANPFKNEDASVIEYILKNHNNADAEFWVSIILSKLDKLSKEGVENGDIIIADEHPANEHLKNPELRDLTRPIFVKGPKRVHYYNREGRVASDGKTNYWYLPTEEGIRHFRDITKRSETKIWTDMLTFGFLEEFTSFDDNRSTGSN
jgi:hypothetical protein